LIVENAAMDFDVIMEEKFVSKIELGDIVSVVGWLSGKIYL
jgi:DNA replicative helicase MCM subunit Mcm2 (Cdc46/Mcm family)